MSAQRFSRVILVVNVFIFVLVAGILTYSFFLKDANLSIGTKSYPFETSELKEGYLVGSVVVTQNDLDQAFNELFENTDENRAILGNWHFAAERLAGQAILQSEGLRLGIFGPQGSTRFSKELVAQAEEYFNDNASTLSLEYLMVPFRISDQPQEDDESRRIEALTAVSNYRNLIEQGSETIASSAEELRTIESFKQIDEDFSTNVYGSSDNEEFPGFFTPDEKLNEQMWTFDAETLTPVLTGQRYDGTSLYDSFFVVAYIEDIYKPEFSSAAQVIDAKLREGMTITLTAK